MFVLRGLGISILCFAIAAAPSVGVAASARQVTSRMAVEFMSGNFNRSLTLAKYGSLKTAGGAASSLAKITFTDVFQSAIIMFVAAAAQVAKDRLDRQRLLSGHQLSYQEVKDATSEAAESLFCGSKNSVTQEVLCSGEFWIGVAGGWTVRSALELTVMNVLKYLLKHSVTRTALIGSVATMAASFLMLGGFVMSGHLWTESVHLLDDPVKENKAHSIFGRAVGQWVSGNWSEYVKSPDGQLAAEVFGNMSSILQNDRDLRGTWLYNGWRFGVARGELIVNLTILMGALSVGSSLGSGLAAVTGVSGFWAVVMVAVVSTFFAGGVSYLTVQFPDLEVGGRLTSLIQDSRAYANRAAHSITRSQLQITIDTFGFDRHWDSRNIQYKFMWERRLNLLMPKLREDRQYLNNVLLEKYQELRLKVDQSKAVVLVATEVIQNSRLRALIVYDEAGTAMTYAEAKRAYCPQVSRTGLRADCEFPLSLQLKKLAAAAKTIQAGEAVLTELAKEILQNFDGDIQFLQTARDNRNLQLPERATLNLEQELKIANTAMNLIEFTFASLHDGLRVERQVQFDSEDLQKAIASSAPSLVSRIYIHGLNEGSLVEDFLKGTTRTRVAGEP